MPKVRKVLGTARQRMPRTPRARIQRNPADPVALRDVRHGILRFTLLRDCRVIDGHIGRRVVTGMDDATLTAIEARAAAVNLDFIGLARSDVPALVAEVRRLTAEIAARAATQRGSDETNDHNARLMDGLCDERDRLTAALVRAESDIDRLSADNETLTDELEIERAIVGAGIPTGSIAERAILRIQEDVDCLVADLADMRADRDRARAALTAITALCDDPPLLVYGINRDIERNPEGRGGSVRHDPATPGYGASGCPGDNITRWFDDLRAILTGGAG